MFTGFYSSLTRQIAEGAVTELAFLRKFKARDVVGQRLVRRPTRELLTMASHELATAIEWLRAATPEDLRRSCQTDIGDRLSAGEVVRLPLCAHLELHLDQLKQAIRHEGQWLPSLRPSGEPSQAPRRGTSFCPRLVHPLACRAGNRPNAG